MYIKLLGLYHMDENNPKFSSYYQKVGTGCFQFVHTKTHATNLSQEECDAVMKYADDYCKMYGASKMVIE